MCMNVLGWRDQVAARSSAVFDTGINRLQASHRFLVRIPLGCFLASVLFFLTASSAFATSLVLDGAPEGERIEFTSYNTDGLHDILAGNWRRDETKIFGDLYSPLGDGPFPAVIFYHGSGHVRTRVSWLSELVPALLDKGIAVFVLDSYTSRGIRGTAADQRKLSKAARIVDAYRALDAIASRPDIDETAIGITGISFGGLVSLYTAHDGLTKAVGGIRKFAAHVPVYPSCQSQFETLAFTGAPIRILAAGKDDYTPAKYCRSYIERLRQAGYAAELIVYPNAHHSFIKAGGPKRCKECATFGACGVGYIDDEGYEAWLDGKATSRDGWKQFVTKVFKACGKRGTTNGGDKGTRDAARNDTVSFFVRHLTRAN